MDAPNRKLRVAHIITQLELGGAQRNTLYTVGHLNPGRFQPLLISGLGGILDEEAKEGGWTTYFARWLVRPVRPWKDLPALVALYRLLRQLKPHVVHTHSSKAGVLGRIAAYLAGVPVIIHTFHGFGFTPNQSRGVRSLFIALEKSCALISTHLVFVSEDNLKEAERLRIGPRTSKSLIRSGIVLSSSPAVAGAQPLRRWRASAEASVADGGSIMATDGFPPEARGNDDKDVRQELGIPEDAWIVAYIGNFKPQKNPMDLARTAFNVLQQDPNVHFLLVGGGELRGHTEEHVKANGIADRVHFLGWRDDASAILASSDCFLLTSLWEGLPRALVEAMAARRPAVAYAVDGVKDILRDGETGFLIPPGDVTVAAEKVLWLKNHPEEARRIGEEARKRVETEFDIDRMVRQQETLYESLYNQVPLKEYYEPLWNPEQK